jgi:hypothetical protein
LEDIISILDPSKFLIGDKTLQANSLSLSVQ